MICVAIALLARVYATQGGLRYQSRGNRYEGVQYSIGVSYVPLALVSATIRNPEFEGPWHPTVDLAFALPKGFSESKDSVMPIVMERKPLLYYRMDKAHVGESSSRLWRTFTWSTKDVLAQTDLGPKDIGVVVRVNQTRAASNEEVCPAILFFGTPPRKIGEYVFDFVAASAFKGDYELLDLSRNKILASGKTSARFENDLTEIVVPSPQTEGWYQLKVSARNSYGSTSGSYSARFYHYTSLPYGI